jgi:hypothetical protein
VSIDNCPKMSVADFFSIPDGTRIYNHYFDQCVALANQYNEGVIGGPFISVDSAFEWWSRNDRYDFYTRETTAKRGDICIASGGLYDGVNGHIFVVTRDWDGHTFGTIEQNGGARWVARYNRTMANVDGFLRPVNQSILGAVQSTPAAVPSGSGLGDHIAAEGSDWTYWVPSTADQATVQAGLVLAGYDIPVDGNLTSDASVRAIQLITGKHGFFDLTYFDGRMNKNLCHAILLLAQALGGYSGRMDWQINGYVWAAFDSAVRSTAPAPAPAAVAAPAPAAVIATPVADAPAEPVAADVVRDAKPAVTRDVTRDTKPAVTRDVTRDTKPKKEPIVIARIVAPTASELSTLSEQIDSATNPEEAGSFDLVSLGFWNYAGERVIKTFAMTFASLLTTTGAVVITNPASADVFAQIGWTYIASAAVISAITSLSVALSSFKNIVTLPVKK